MDVLVCDLGFSAMKWLYDERKGRVISAFNYDGEEMVIGEKVLLSAGSSYLKTMEELVRYYPVFVEHCQRMAAIRGDVMLAVGLPYSYWLEQKKPGGAVSALARSLTHGAVKEVMIFPQGLGGIRDYLDSLSERPTGNSSRHRYRVQYRHLHVVLTATETDYIRKDPQQTWGPSDGDELSFTAHQESGAVRKFCPAGISLPYRKRLSPVRL